MNPRHLRRLLWAYLAVLLPLAIFAARYDAYGVDGDAVSYMDLADLIRAHNWPAAVNGYWHPLYPAFLAAGMSVFHSTRFNELAAFYAVNIVIFALEAASMVLLVHGLVRLRNRLAPAVDTLFSLDALCLLALSLLVIATMRELSLGKVRTDSLLQALIFTGIGLLMEALAAEGTAAWVFSALMGVTLGFAYLTKSFAFLLALLSVTVLVAFAVLVCRRKLILSAAQGALALVCFGLVAGPYIAALSHQQGRFDFGDSGNLNYVWYISGTEKMHLQPRMTSSFGSADVKLKHPEKELMQSPGVYSYTAMTNGTYPPWFNPTYWNDQIKPRFSLRLLVRRDIRNVVLIFRYLLNHPEALVLLAVLLCTCASLRGTSRFAWPVAGLGVLIWAIYALVNVEERYVTAAYLLIVMGAFAAMKPSRSVAAHRVAACTLVLFALLPPAAMAREAAENRRQQSIVGQVPAWREPQIFGAAHALQAMGIRPGDQVACIGTIACVRDHYWARLAGVRITSEIYAPDAKHLAVQLDAMSNREEAFAKLRSQGARIVVGAFDPGEMNPSHASTAGWQRLGETQYYALPLDERRTTQP